MSDTSDRREQLDRFRQVIASRLGLRFEDDKLPLLATVEAERRSALGAVDFESYLARLASTEGGREVGPLAERLTVGETYFFRNGNDLRAFQAVVVPARMRARGGERRLRIASIGCASGEEPYTIAMLLRGVPELASWEVSVLGVDVNPAAIARAREASYSTWSLRQTSPEMRARYFRPARGGFRVVDEVRELVSFEERNVVEDDPALWSRSRYDVVFCRNVVMYFVPEVTRLVVGRIATALTPGGFLFLGHAETLRGVSGAFHLLHSHDTFYYQLRGDEAQSTTGLQDPRAPAPHAAVPRTGSAVREATPLDATGWVSAVEEASRNVLGLVQRRSSEAAPTPPPETDSGRGRVLRALELLGQDRHADALSALGGAAQDEDADALLLRAVLLASSGDPGTSERVCARILERDELNAEAHYVMALCREHAGDRAGAVNHDHYALYLDPSFAMPRLHLGLLAKRDGDTEGAWKELTRALVLLAAEDGSRILLLGGGFSRDALLDLCRAELRARGETW